MIKSFIIHLLKMKKTEIIEIDFKRKEEVTADSEGFVATANGKLRVFKR